MTNNSIPSGIKRKVQAWSWSSGNNWTKTFIIFISSLASPLLDYVAPADPLHGAQLLHLLSQVLELLQLPGEGALGAVLDGQHHGFSSSVPESRCVATRTPHNIFTNSAFSQFATIFSPPLLVILPNLTHCHASYAHCFTFLTKSEI